MSVTRMAMVIVLTCTVACRSSSESQHRAANRANSNVLGQQQLAATNSDNLFDAITKIRPEWLTSRGATSATNMALTSPSVYMNGMMLGKADVLKDVRLLDVTEVKYWNAGQASARFGMGHPRGVLEISRK